MPNYKVPQLPVLSIPSGGTLFYVVDVNDTTDDPTGSSKQMTRDSVFKNLTLPTNTNTNTQLLSRNPTTGDMEYVDATATYVGLFNYGMANAIMTGTFLT